MQDPEHAISCDNCNHKMSGAVYTNVMQLDSSIPDERIHIRLDESLAEPKTYGCICGHFTLVGMSMHLEAYLKNRRRPRRPF